MWCGGRVGERSRPEGDADAQGTAVQCRAALFTVDRTSEVDGNGRVESTTSSSAAMLTGVIDPADVAVYHSCGSQRSGATEQLVLLNVLLFNCNRNLCRSKQLPSARCSSNRATTPREVLDHSRPFSAQGAAHRRRMQQVHAVSACRGRAEQRPEVSLSLSAGDRSQSVNAAACSRAVLAVRPSRLGLVSKRAPRGDRG